MNPGVLSQLNYGTSHKAVHVVRYFVGAVLRRARHKCTVRQNQMGKKCCGLETGRQVSNLHLPDSRPGVLSPLNYIRIRFRFG